jgi:hypothetical protein
VRAVDLVTKHVRSLTLSHIYLIPSGLFRKERRRLKRHNIRRADCSRG